MKSRKRKPANKRKSHKKRATRQTTRRRRQVKHRIKKRGPLFHRNALPRNPREAAVKKRVFRALGRMRRDGESASRAAHLEGLKLETFIRHARPALRRGGPGKPWKAIPEDQLAAAIKIHTKFGPTTEIVRSSRERRLLGRYNVALRMFRAGEDGAEKALSAFRGKTVAGHTLITDAKLLIKLEEAGKLDFDDLYSSFEDES
jgi:hypothetical protein